MAERLGDLRIALSMDSRQYKKEMREINARMQNLRSEYQSVSDGSREFNNSMDGLRAKSSTLRREIVLQEQVTEALRNRMEELRRTQGENSLEFIRAQTTYNKAQGSLNKLNASYERTNNAIVRLHQEARQMNDEIEESSRRSFSFGSVMGGLKERLAGVGSGLKTFSLNLAKIGSTLAVAVPLVTALGASVMTVGSAMVSAGAGTVGFGAVAISTLGKIFEASENVAAAQEKIDQATNSEERKAAVEEMNQIYAGLNKNQRDALKSLQNFKTFWGEFTKQFEKPIFQAFQNGLSFLQSALQLSKPMIHSVADAVVRLTESLKNSLGSEEVKGLFKWFGETAGTYLQSFANTAGYAILGVLNLFKAFAPASDMSVKGIENVAKKFADWTASLENNKTLQTYINYLKTALPTVFGTLGKVFKFLFDTWAAMVPVLAPVGTKFMEIVGVVGTFISKLSEATLHSQSFRDKVVQVFQKVKEFVKPIIQEVANFVNEKVKSIKQFWDENGKQILQACQNAFKGIQAVISFVMPFVLAIIKSVWNNIKGVITGALNIIMGATKVFSGLFTGDFRKMWEGIKQMFKGAIETVWNGVQLLFYGRIIKGAVGFVKGFKETLQGGWKAAIAGIVQFAKDGVKKVGDFIKGAKDHFDDLIKAAKELPGKMGDGIKAMAKGVKKGISALAQTMADGLGVAVNGVIEGVNWVLGKVGVKEKNQIDKWKVPKYAQGTKSKNGHPGGLAWLGDGKRKEAYVTPDGNVGISPNKDTLYNLPKGTHVFNGAQTKQLMDDGMIPKYEGGTVGNWFKQQGQNIKNTAVAAKDKVVAGAKKVKDLSLDVWEYASDPKKLLNKVWEKLGVSVPNVGGQLRGLLTGGVNKVKDASIDYVKKKMEDLGEFFGGGGSVGASGKGAAAWRPAIIAAAAAMKESISEREIQGIIAQIHRESGGNEKITQSSAVVDINTLSGNPARGLLQYIRQTFAAYSLPGHKNIYSGYDQLLAFFNNKTWRRDLPYGRRGWGPRGGRKYESGGVAAFPQTAQLAENGYPEFIIPTEKKYRTRALSLLGQASNALGVTRPNSPIQVVVDNSETNALLREQNTLLKAALAKSTVIALDSKEVGRAVSSHVTKFQKEDSKITYRFTGN
jgi:SLT domain-containing protein/phage-related protein